MCLAQGHNAVTLIRLKPAALRFQVKHSATEPLLSQNSDQAGQHVGPDLDQNDLQRLSADNTGMKKAT